MLEALIIAGVIVAALACPVMMWLGRRGIGPGCAMGTCAPSRERDTLEELRSRQRELEERIARAEAQSRVPTRRGVQKLTPRREAVRSE